MHLGEIFHVLMSDSAYASHLSTNGERVWTFTPCFGLIQVGNNETTESCGIGRVVVETTVNGKKHRDYLMDAVYAPGMAHYPISISKVLIIEVRTTVDKGPPGCRLMELQHKPMSVAHLNSIKTKECHYQALLCFRRDEEAHQYIALSKRIMS